MASLEELAVTVGVHGEQIEGLEKRFDQHCAENAAEKKARDAFEQKILDETFRRLSPGTATIIAILSSLSTGLIVAFVRR